MSFEHQEPIVHEIRPWVRANLQELDLDTFMLIPDDKKLEYVLLMQELKDTGAAYNLALAHQSQFFKGLAYE